jgi:hypothetical protein
MDNDIIPRDPYCNNKTMMDKCQIIKDIVLKTKVIKERVGRKYVEKEVLRFKTDKETIDRIVRSYEHYKKLYENEIESST